MKFYTNYPFEFLGDTQRREIDVISYDGKNHCKILVEDCETEIKLDYIEIEMEHYVDKIGVRYFGTAKHLRDNKFQCHAFVDGALCLVEFGLFPNE